MSAVAAGMARDCDWMVRRVSWLRRCGGIASVPVTPGAPPLQARRRVCCALRHRRSVWLRGCRWAARPASWAPWRRSGSCSRSRTARRCARWRLLARRGLATQLLRDGTGV